MEKVKRATAILEEIFRANPKTADLTVSFNKFGDSALNIYVDPHLERHGWQGAIGADAGVESADQAAVRGGAD